MTVLTTDRVLVDIKTLLQFWFPRTVELFDEEQHRLETWRTGAANHRSTDRGQENSAAALVSAHGGTLRQRTKTVQRRWFPRTVELFDKEQHNLRLGVRALLIIVRLIVDKKVQRRWFPRTVELFERHRLETWRTGAANHRSTDRGQENSAAALVSARWNSSTNNGTDLRLGVRALLIIVRLIVDKKTVQRRWFRTVELFDEEQHRLETWRTGAANHQSTDRGQENSAAALVSAHGGTLRQRTAQT
ncbi:hypothetical protein EVAR_7158_1 [Eumeta japonica]|uniref:Uncharacterized protein n=1 Tax=Eumeta variegata TaxID=151549 RepID=A0A4C1U6E0_EUMVA|nr:hypothetical protein EVAR_7158_1 [Eumeta japonica]